MTSISASALTSLTGKTTDSANKVSDQYNQFLNLLTTQLQHQDPLDPMDSSAFTSQLVSFSQVEQSIQTNQKLDAMLSQSQSNVVSQSLGYIGKDVYYKGTSAYYDGKQAETKMAYAIDGEYATAKLHITDKDGVLVRTLPVPGATPSGSITWDGKDDEGNQLPLGNYTVAVDALNATGNQVDTYTAIPGHVQGIETVDGVLYLALTGESRIDANNVLSISNADDKAVVTDPATTTS